MSSETLLVIKMDKITPEWLDEYMVLRQLSQEDLAKLLKLSRKTINRWINGVTPIPDDLRDRLNALGITVNRDLLRPRPEVILTRCGRSYTCELRYPDNGEVKHVLYKNLKWFLVEPHSRRRKRGQGSDED